MVWDENFDGRPEQEVRRSKLEAGCGNVEYRVEYRRNHMYRQERRIVENAQSLLVIFGAVYPLESVR